MNKISFKSGYCDFEGVTPEDFPVQYISICRVRAREVLKLPKNTMAFELRYAVKNPKKKGWQKLSFHRIVNKDKEYFLFFPSHAVVLSSVEYALDYLVKKHKLLPVNNNIDIWVTAKPTLTRKEWVNENRKKYN